MSALDEMTISEVMPTVEALLEPSPLEDELQVMQWLVDGFAPLDALARQRVLAWATARYGEGDSALLVIARGLTEMIDAVAKHQEMAGSSAQLQDRELYDRVLKGTRFERAEDTL